MHSILIGIFFTMVTYSVKGSQIKSPLTRPEPETGSRTFIAQGEDIAAMFEGVTFAKSRDVADGKTEYRALKDNVLGVETVIEEFGEAALYFREVTDGKRVLKLVYAGRNGLAQCDVKTDTSSVDNLIAKFLQGMPDTGDSSTGGPLNAGETTQVPMIQNDTVGDEPYASILNIEFLHVQCVRLQSQMLLNLVDAPKRRHKRFLFFPTTKWCGKGNEAEDYDDLGTSIQADQCCRAHDKCDLQLKAFSRKYGTCNPHYYTISHCNCDKVFRTCLKTAGTATAYLMGYLIFDVFNMECFEFENKDVCVELHWLGGCKRWESWRVAKIKGPIEWP